VVTVNDHRKFCRCAECEPRRGHGHAGMSGALLAVAVFCELGWLLTAWPSWMRI
jgi:hypothetical protein